jgi:glycosyltransferase involved in cell wall biosynthesis
MGGIERASSTIADFCAEKGHDVLYLAIFKHPKFFKLHPEIRYDEPLDGSNVTSLNLFKTISRIRSVVKSYNPDSILAFNKLYAGLTLIATIGLRKKVFISERSSPLYKWPKKMELINLFAFAVHPPAGIIAQTQIAAAYQQKKVSKNTRIAIIPNALREVRFYPEIARENWILAVGRLDDHLKGFDLLIEAYAKCRNKNWKLVFAGGDENGAHLKKKAGESGIPDNIIFLGKVENIDAVYAQASIFVIPSRSEGFPNALCEAMAAGLACVSFDFVAGPRDIISDGTDGVIVQMGNTDAMAAAIDELIENPSQRSTMGEKAKRIAQRLNTEKIGKQYLDFILCPS